MHNHNNNKNSEHKRMMWMMIPCLLLLGVLFLGGGKLSGGGYLWPILIGGFVLLHVLMMFKGHGGHGVIDTDAKTDVGEESKTKDEHKKNE